ncbi:hypothetical protein SASC598O02_001690, partial [Snodgrassella alvi SCGC AB-598-O02]
MRNLAANFFGKYKKVLFLFFIIFAGVVFAADLRKRNCPRIPLLGKR